MVGMSLTSCLFSRRHSARGTVVKKDPLFNKNTMYLIEEISWNLGFKNETQAEGRNYMHYTNYLRYFSYTYYTNYINYFTGSDQTRNSRSRLAGKARCNCRDY
jgi:hypothetical protein